MLSIRRPENTRRGAGLSTSLAQVKEGKAGVTRRSRNSESNRQRNRSGRNPTKDSLRAGIFFFFEGLLLCSGPRMVPGTQYMLIKCLCSISVRTDKRQAEGTDRW